MDSCFDPDARWELLQPDLSRRLQEPTEGTGLVGPTSYASGAAMEAPKYHYDIEIDREPSLLFQKSLF